MGADYWVTLIGNIATVAMSLLSTGLFIYIIGSTYGSDEIYRFIIKLLEKLEER